MANEVEKIEANVAVNAVAEADKKVADIKAEKAAKKAAKHQETLVKHPRIGKFLNWVDDHKVHIITGALTGGAGFVGGVLWERHINKASGNSEPEIQEIEETEAEPPFDTEA